MQPVCTTRHESKYEENYGNAWQQKVFVQNRMKNSEEKHVTRSVKICTVLVFTSLVMDAIRQTVSVRISRTGSVPAAPKAER